MLKSERQERIIQTLSTDGKVVASKIAVELGVSEDTVRRDLLELDQKGLLKRVYGGALPVARPVVDYLERENKNLELKQRMAVKGLDLLKQGQLVVIDGSSSNLVFARCIPADLQLTVITNSCQIAQVCYDKDMEVLLIGGTLLRETMTIVGDVAVEQAGLYHPDLCFMGVYGLHPEYGFTIPYQREVGVKRRLIERSSKVISFVDPVKFNTVSRYQVCGIEAFTTLITDDSALGALQEYRHRGLECI